MMRQIRILKSEKDVRYVRRLKQINTQPPGNSLQETNNLKVKINIKIYFEYQQKKKIF